MHHSPIDRSLLVLLSPYKCNERAAVARRLRFAQIHASVELSCRRLPQDPRVLRAYHARETQTTQSRNPSGFQSSERSVRQYPKDDEPLFTFSTIARDITRRMHAPLGRGSMHTPTTRNATDRMKP